MPIDLNGLPIPATIYLVGGAHFAAHNLSSQYIRHTFANAVTRVRSLAWCFKWILIISTHRSYEEDAPTMMIRRGGGGVLWREVDGVNKMWTICDFHFRPLCNLHRNYSVIAALLLLLLFFKNSCRCFASVFLFFVLYEYVKRSYIVLHFLSLICGTYRANWWRRRRRKLKTTWSYSNLSV